MHCWGDDWPHWDELYQAENYIGKYVYKWSRCRLQSKEKYGTIRYQQLWPPCKGSGFIIRLPWKSKVSWSKEPVRRIVWMWSDSWAYHKWRQWGGKMLERAVKKACIRFPNVKTEITEDLDWFLS